MKHALITGGASGLGESLVKKFVSEGFKVTYTYNNSKPKLKIEDGALNSIKIDLSKSDEIIKLNDVFKNQKIDVFINNAALSIKTPFTQIEEDELRSIFEVNVISSFKLMQKAFINMQKNNGGKIINIGSIGGQIGVLIKYIMHLRKALKRALSNHLQELVLRIKFIHLTSHQAALTRKC